MSPELVGAIGIVILIVLLFMRIWLGAVMVLIGFLGFSYLTDIGSALVVVGRNPYSTFSQYSITAVPLFILMGSVVSYGGLAKDLFGTAYNWLGRLRGGLAVSAVAACTGFAAISGSSMATVASLGKMIVPEMKKYNYDEKLISGSIAAGATIGILIPPSMGFILYGILTEVSIGKLFMAGIIPGILQAVFYAITIFVMCRFNQRLGPPGLKTSLKVKVSSLKHTWGVLVLFLLVMGGIYMGIFTPTEAGAVGAFGAIIICLIGRRLNKQVLKSSFVETAQFTAMIGFLICGVFILMRFLAVSKLPFALSDIVAGLNVTPLVILIAIIVLYIILGCFLDVMTAIVLTSPIIFPVIFNLGFDPVWFGVIMVRMMEIGAITPPMGMNVFILAAVTDVPAGRIFRGVIPFVIADFLHVALLVAVPALSLFLPNSM
ncbi:MAG: TRAP transporter large permease [Dehalococcoidales bacterium]|nr:TRAP transporter large permease [Dehalococcoidales bacterium]